MVEKCNRQFGCHSCTAHLRKLQEVMDQVYEMINAIIEKDEEFTREQVEKLKKGGY